MYSIIINNKCTVIIRKLSEQEELLDSVMTINSAIMNEHS